MRWCLRARLLLAFALVATVTASAVAGWMYVQARNVILQKAQDAAVVAMTDEVTTLSPPLRLPPTTTELAEIASELSGRDTAAVAVYRDLRGGDLDVGVLSPHLRDVVRRGEVAWQRVWVDEQPQLVIGMRLGVGLSWPTGIELYTMRSLRSEHDSVGRLATIAWLTGGLSLLLALLLAVVAAGNVLRPVRELRRAARRLGEGDLTTRLAVRGTDELAEVASTFNDTAESLAHHVGELRRLEADARRFVADVSHELRTPLAAMTAVTDVLNEEAERLPGDAGEAARLVSRETHNLTRLVNDLIEITRFDSGAASLATDEVDVADAVAATLRARGYSDRVDADLPSLRARVDPRRLDVIVANLVGNALTHGAPPVSVRLRDDGDWFTIEVADRGPGLDPRVLPHVFDRFYKADTARARSAGSGLGLAIAWENARLHGGALVAGTRVGGGAVFTLRLPRGVA